MTEEELEGNILIAEKLFEGKLIHPEEGDCLTLPHYKIMIVNGWLDTTKAYTPDQLEFHSSFDWIIPAINRLPWSVGAKSGLSLQNSISKKFLFDRVVEWLKKNQ